MSSNNSIFVADKKTNKDLAAFIKMLEKFNKVKEDMMEETKAFMRKIKERINAAEEELEPMWEKLFQVMQATGHIEKDLKFDEYIMNINPEVGQLFISKTEEEKDEYENMPESIRQAIKAAKAAGAKVKMQKISISPDGKEITHPEVEI